jgi:hypothetical protein
MRGRVSGLGSHSKEQKGWGQGQGRKMNFLRYLEEEIMKGAFLTEVLGNLEEFAYSLPPR